MAAPTKAQKLARVMDSDYSVMMKVNNSLSWPTMSTEFGKAWNSGGFSIYAPGGTAAAAATIASETYNDDTIDGYWRRVWYFKRVLTDRTETFVIGRAGINFPKTAGVIAAPFFGINFRGLNGTVAWANDDAIWDICERIRALFSSYGAQYKIPMSEVEAEV